MTLPLIYALNHASQADKRRITYIVKNNSTDRHKVNEVISYVQQSGGIQYAHDKMMQYKQDALAILNAFPDSPALQAMRELVDYVIDRKY